MSEVKEYRGYHPEVVKCHSWGFIRGSEPFTTWAFASPQAARQAAAVLRRIAVKIASNCRPGSNTYEHWGHTYRQFTVRRRGRDVTLTAKDWGA